MDLTGIATAARDAAAAAERVRRQHDADVARVNDASRLRGAFSELLQVVVAEADLIWCPKARKHIVIVDGHRLGLGVGQSRYETTGSQVRLVPYYLDDDGEANHMDVSLTLHDAVANFADLGKVLARTSGHHLHGELRRYVPGEGLVPIAGSEEYCS